MILTLAQITDIIRNNPNKDLVSEAQKHSKKLRMHINGFNYESEIGNIEGHEKEELRELRKKYSKSNKPLFSRLSRPIDKVFSAKGGSVYYNMADASNKRAAALSSNVKDGISLRKWIQTKWVPHFLDDPNGLIFMEIGTPVNNTPNTYPTYKSITTVYDYLPAGSSLEYVVFKVEGADKEKVGYKKEDEIYRVVDDSFDYWVKWQDDTATILSNASYPNYFSKVPAILNSDLHNPECEGIMLSLFSDVVEDADDFLLTGSIRNLAKIRMAYPKYWEYGSDCPKCKGEGELHGETCTYCKGTGKNLMTTPGVSKILDWPESKDYPVLTPNIAGFVEFPQAYFDNATLELSQLENYMSLTVWGTETRQQPQPMSADKGGTVKTATQVIDDIQPKADRLHAISEMAEKREKFIIDSIIQIGLDSSYKGASINYGRRYMLEGPDELWLKYEDARTKGAAMSILDDLLMEYIETKYSSDPIGMNIQLKLLVVEPFIHFTVQQVKEMAPAFEDYGKKLYFSEWLATLNEAMLLSFSADELKAQLADYVKAKKMVELKPESVKAGLN